MNTATMTSEVFLSPRTLGIIVGGFLALKYDKSNHILQYCMAGNVSGVIGSAVAAGVLISFPG